MLHGSIKTERTIETDNTKAKVRFQKLIIGYFQVYNDISPNLETETN